MAARAFRPSTVKTATTTRSLWRSANRQVIHQARTSSRLFSAQSQQGVNVDMESQVTIGSADASSKDGEGTSKEETPTHRVSPWNDPRVEERSKSKTSRCRQHVNPLSRRFQMNTELPEDWPHNVFDDMSRPMFLDIGCARGGFLVDVATKYPRKYNYMGLEIRPIVVRHAQDRVSKHGLDGFLTFVGCNANVDLDRLMDLADAKDKLQMVTIQFPDPHFKSQHAKRRVVTQELVTTLARYMPEGSTVFLQSDIQSVLDEMRESFRMQPEFFCDELESTEEYHDNNLIGVPTEREISVLKRDLPVFRAVFKRTAAVAVGN
eukprot:CAMPEP_0198130420 /NCGR_PEP_ID=MMETSP1442-20131203/53948_1 /TAXON_ID= /ORGANISM="Craspedostauros australis, Strain CCMP3328" /LENGTH=319 /DNA_ID=CAMNT_0043791039 /DNA_START=206 /DNA_END=1165 /DNA_ORIENTATION=+